jgi:hypothetical protein
VRRRVPPHVGAVEASADGAVLRIGADQAAWHELPHWVRARLRSR